MKMIFISGSSGGLPTQSLSVGTSSYLSMSYAGYGYAAEQHRAISLWVQLSDLSPGATMSIGKVGEELLILENSAYGLCRITYQTYNSSGAIAAKAVSSSTFPVGEYRHIFVETWQKGSPYIRIYIDGTEVSYSLNSPATGVIIKNSGSDFRINNPSRSALIYQLGMFSDNTLGLPLIGDVYASGRKDFSADPALYSYLDISGGDVTSDAELAAAWTNTGAVTASSTIPT
jgi:hypothetical protein